MIYGGGGDVKDWPAVMSTSDAAEYLQLRIGTLAPMETTLGGWARPSWQAANRARIENERIPIGVVVPGAKKVGWTRASLDRYADSIIAHVERETAAGDGASPADDSAS